MTNVLSPSLRSAIALEKYGFHHSHSLGQNFITDDGLIESLLDAACVGPEDYVLEIGPGAGIMTAALANRCKKVVAIELDRRLEGVLADVLAPHDNAFVVFQDVMKADIAAIAGQYFQASKFRVVANLPYYITSDVIMRLLTAGLPLESISVMVQKEAAERLMAEMGEKNWCALSATVQYFTLPRILADVPPHAFTPPPHVESRFICLDVLEQRPVQPLDEALFLKTVQCAFAMRRKTLANNIKAVFCVDMQQAQAILQQAGIENEKVRGEALDLQGLCSVADALYRAGYGKITE